MELHLCLEKNLLTLRLLKSKDENTNSFYYQDLFLHSGLQMPNEYHGFPITHDIHCLFVGFALL